MGNFVVLLLHALNLELGFDKDEDSCEDPESDPCCRSDFFLPAFNEATNFNLLGGCCC